VDHKPDDTPVTAADRAAEMFGYTSVGGFARTGKQDRFDRLRTAFGKDRGWSDCYGHLLVATRRTDVMVDPLLAPWDAAALKVVVEESGGTFTDPAGQATHRGGSGMSTNGALFEAARAAVAE
jgi:fructose-1,6-bisphosphatase/inositol monophosphatase family enzyme